MIALRRQPAIGYFQPGRSRRRRIFHLAADSHESRGQLPRNGCMPAEADLDAADGQPDLRFSRVDGYATPGCAMQPASQPPLPRFASLPRRDDCIDSQPPPPTFSRSR